MGLPCSLRSMRRQWLRQLSRQLHWHALACAAESCSSA